MNRKAKKSVGSTPLTRPSTAQIRETMQRRNSRWYKYTNSIKATSSRCLNYFYQIVLDIGVGLFFLKSLISTIAFSIGLLLAVTYLLIVDHSFANYKEIWILIPILLNLTRNLLMTLLSRIRLLIDRDLFSTKRQQREAIVANSILLVLQSVVGSMIAAAMAMLLFHISSNNSEHKSKKALVMYAASIVTTVVGVLVFGLFIMIVKLFGGHKDTDVIINSVIGITSAPLIIVLLHQLAERFRDFIETHGHLLPVMIMFSLLLGWYLWGKVAYSPLTRSAVWNGSIHLIMSTLMCSVSSSMFEKGQRGPEKYLFIYQLLISGVTMNLIGIYTHQAGRMLNPIDGPTRLSYQFRVQREGTLCTLLGVVAIIVHSSNFTLLHQLEPFKSMYYFNYNWSFFGIFYLPVSILVLSSLFVFSRVFLDGLGHSRDEPDQVAIPYVTVLSDSIASSSVYLGYHFYITRR